MAGGAVTRRGGALSFEPLRPDNLRDQFGGAVHHQPGTSRSPISRAARRGGRRRLWGTPTLDPHDPPPQDAGGRWADGQRPPCSSRPAEAPAEATARLAGRPPHPMGSCRCHRPPPGHESSATTKTKQVKGLIHYHPITPPPHPTTQVPRSTTTLSRLTTQPPTPSPNHPAVLPHYLIIPTLPTLPPHHPTNLHLNPPPPPTPPPIPTKHPTPPHHPTIPSSQSTKPTPHHDLGSHSAFITITTVIRITPPQVLDHPPTPNLPHFV